nr:DNA ligase [Gemmatimonadales bacterium]
MSPKRNVTPDRLAAYRAKRSLERTPEPAGAVAAGSGRLFIVHQHAARRLHFDLRLEMEGVLRSWAVPKGPSFDTADKRLAVLVEDHPLEYGDFEGLIPGGNYGAGAVIVWDRGRWTPVGDPREGLDKGKLLFELEGYKLHGLWTLVKLKKSEKEWLFIKERDGWASADLVPGAESVLSGLTVEDLGAGRNRGEAIRGELLRLGAPRKPVEAKSAGVMLAQPAECAFSRDGWLFEPKLDGYRVLAARERGEVRLRTRNGNECETGFPEVARAVAALPFDRLLLDGEVVALDGAGLPSFQRLQGRARLRRPIDIRHATVESPVTYYAFDLLGFEDFDLRPLPLTARKAVLQRVLPPVGALRYLEHVDREGEVLYREAERLGLEGVVAKKAASPYKAGRSAAWLKIRSRRTGDFVVVGFTAPKGSRGGFGALHLAEYVDGALVYTGRVGSGFTDSELAEVSRTLQRHRRVGPPCGGPVPTEKGTTWAEPVLVCEVEYTEWTDEGLLRQPVFLRFRDDKRPEECRRLGGQGDVTPSRAERGTFSARSEPLPRKVPRSARDDIEPPFPLTNLGKVFWPDDHYTKGDLVEY